MTLRHVDTPVLSVAYHDSGPAGGRPLFLLHGLAHFPQREDPAAVLHHLLPFLGNPI